MLNPGVVGGSSNSDPFPAGLRVLVVDDDPTCLMILERMLRTCLYRGTLSNFCFSFLFFLHFNLKCIQRFTHHHGRVLQLNSWSNLRNFIGNLFLCVWILIR